MLLQFVKRVPERLFIANATEDDVRMLLLGREKGACRVDSGMTGLDGLLNGREILADEYIHIGNLRHGCPPNGILETALAGTRTRTVRRLERPALPLSYESA